MRRVEQFTRILVERLATCGAFGEAQPAVQFSGADGWVGLPDRWLLRVVLTDDHIDVWTRPPAGGRWQPLAVSTPADLDACLPAVEASVRAWAPRLTPYRLRAGARYRIVRPFEDFYGHAFAAGEMLTYLDRSFLPHEDGHTLRFEERTMWIQGGSAEYDHFGLCVVEAAQAPW